MKRNFLFAAALLAGFSAFADEIPSTSTEIYDQSPWANDQILKLFSTAWDAGRNYPTKAEFEAIGLTTDLEFVRSHTRYRSIYKDADKDIVSDINHDRNLWCNLPGGIGKGTGGYPSTTFDQDVFSMWNYTNLFGSWNYGFLLAPGAWVDAAHKNGTRIYGGIKFFESWNNDGSESTFNQFIATKNADGTYKYARAFVNAAAYFGNDGYNYNQEGTTYSSTDWINFHKSVMDVARSVNLEGFGIGQYTQNAGLSSTNMGYLYGDKSTGKIYDCMLNYSGNMLGYRNAPTSISLAEGSNGIGLDGLYQGQLLVGLAGDYWTQMNTDVTKKMNICIWGEHDQSRFFQFRVGSDPINVQENYQKLLEKAFSGANRNPLKRPEINNSWGSFQVGSAAEADNQLNNSPGFASMFPERTAIGGNLPFETHFNLGNGENYFYKGKVTHGSWYNMSQQDIVPTYRWLVTAKGNMTTYANDIDVKFTHEDSYVGGSSLKVTGATTAGNDIILYRTALKVTKGDVKANVALKGKAGASNMSVILKKKGQNAWIEVPFGDFAGKTWEEKELAVSGLSVGDEIEYIGIRVNGGTAADYCVNVGKIKISDGRTAKQAPIKKESVIVEVKEETAASLSVKLGWEPDCNGYSTSINEYGMVWNDEINVDHFEILYKEGENGKVKEVGRTSQWATYIGNLPMTQSTDAYVGVRSVSTDLKSVSPTEWVRIPHYAGTLPEVPEEDPYPACWMETTGNSSMEDIIKYIWTEQVITTGATQDLNYTASANPDQTGKQYYYAKDNKLIVTQGQTITLKYKGTALIGGGANQKYCLIYGYIDYDGNYSFGDADETLASFGERNKGVATIVDPGITVTIKIPEDARVGESRLRFVGSDAWDPHPGFAGGTRKGFCIDFPVEIQGTNPGRGVAETYKDRRDQGEADEPENLLGAINGVSADTDFSSVAVVDNVAYFTNTDKAWFYDVNGRCVKFAGNVTEGVALNELTAGVYVVKMLNGQVVRSAKVVVK